MTEPALTQVIAAVTLYVALLFALALWAERQERRGRKVASNAVVWSLSLAVYCTTWTYYGSVGFAATSGLLFLTVYLGPTLVVVVWWTVLRKLLRVKAAHQVTGLADLLSFRYGKSQKVALFVTCVLVVGLVPYLALQLETMISTVALLTGHDPARVYPAIGEKVGPPIVLLMIVFTIAFGLRRLSPTERHPGMMVAVAAESVVKLVAFAAAGVFVTWGIFAGPGELYREATSPQAALPSLMGPGHGVTTWLSHMLLSASAILFLPRQFHVAVVENADERHLRTAMWLFPTYLLAINLFVLPLAVGGLLLGYPASEADTYVLRIPYEAGQPALTWLVFLGGFSAGTGMVVVETMALATMLSNHVILPALSLTPRLERLRRHLIYARWAAAALVILTAYGYERAFGQNYELVSIGLTSFAAVLQLAPPVLGGLFWRGASTPGAMAGLAGGFVTWGYTLGLPVFANAGWLPMSLLTQGPFGIEALRPEALFGIHLDRLSHAVLWSMIVNVGLFVFVSLLYPASEEEEVRAGRIVDVLAGASPRPAPEAEPREVADAAEKRARIVRVVSEYREARDAERIADECLARVGASVPGRLSALQLAELEGEVETALAASVGTASAHAALKRESLVSPVEARAISRAYADILASLKMTPAELQRRIDYHREREKILEEAVRGRDEFLAVASHELKTPLTPLSIKVQTLLRLSARGDLARVPRATLDELLKGTEGQIRRLVALVDDLLDVSRITTKKLRLHLEPMDLVSAVQEVIERHRAELTQARCDVSLRAEPAVIGRWDRLRIEQVFTNLLTNAMKHAPERPVEVHVDSVEDRARLVVRDHGPGIPPEDQDRIFRPFERAVSYLKVSGFGLGLYIVREIVEAHGGAVRLDSAPGRGSAFIVELPREPSAPASA